jgi:hypothetical protein
MTSRTSVSGALAPAVRPSVLMPSSHAGSISLARWTRRAGAASRGDLDQPHRVRRIGRADHEQHLDLGAIALTAA